MAVSVDREVKVGAVTGRGEQLSARGQLRDVCHIDGSGAERDEVGAAIRIQEDAVIVIGVPATDARNGIACFKVEGEGAEFDWP